jgi:hypothetical protein
VQVGFEFRLLTLVTHLAHPRNKTISHLNLDLLVSGVVGQVIPLVRIVHNVEQLFTGPVLIATDLVGRIGVGGRLFPP